jgi:DNA polymerase-3 subunit delta
MLLKQTQLTNHLTQGLQALYVLVGDEPLAQRETLDAIRAQARQENVEERTSLIAERNFNWQQVQYYGQSASLFASKRLLEISIPSGKPGVEGGKALQKLADNPIPDTSVVIILPALEREAKSSAWYSRLENQAIVIALNEVEAAQLPKWIDARLKEQQQVTSQETLEFLAHQVEGNLLAANQEIQKLGLLYPQGALTDEQVREAVLNVSRYDAFQLGEAVLAGDTARTVRVLQGLQDEGEQALAVMNPLLWTLRPLVHVKLAQSRGDNVEQAMTRARIFGNKQTIVKRMLNKVSLRQLEAALQKLADIDQTAKGVMQGDAWLEISRLCFGLAKLCAR